MSCVGIGKTTLANEICVKWARDGFLAKDFDVVLLIPLRSVQGRPIKEVVIQYIGGEEAYELLKKSRGERCLIIFEGFDEVSAEHRSSDKFLVSVIKECSMLEEATILITSRPHACSNVNPGRMVEIVGFGNSEIKQFAENSFTDLQTVEEFLIQLNDYPHIRSLCYIPMNLVMIVDIFQVNKKLPSTLTELYQLFIVMILQRQFDKENENKPLCSSVKIPAVNKEMLCRTLKCIPMKAAEMLLVLSKLAYCGFFYWYSSKEEQGYFKKRTRKWKDPKIIFTTEDLTQCDIEVSPDWDGYGLLKATPTHNVPVDNITYNFAHLTIQEFLCAVYLSTLLSQERQRIMSEYFDDYPNVFIYLCGLTRLVCPTAAQFVFEKLKSSSETGVVTALRCVYESTQADPPQSATPFELDLNHNTLLPYDCLTVGYVLSHYPVMLLNMSRCHIGNSGAEMLAKIYSGHTLQDLDVWDNDLTVAGVRNVMKIVMKSQSHY